MARSNGLSGSGQGTGGVSRRGSIRVGGLRRLNVLAGLRSGFGRGRDRSALGLSLTLLAAMLLGVLGLVPIAVISAPTALATGPTVLILSTSVYGSPSAEQLAAESATGLDATVTVVNATTWDSMSEAEFASYTAIILGDPDCGTSASTALGAAVTNESTWTAAVTGNVVVIGAAPVGQAGGNSAGGDTLMDDAIEYAGSDAGHTGLYGSLSCYYSSASADTTVSSLSDLGTFKVQGAASCSDNPATNEVVRDGMSEFDGTTEYTSSLTDEDLTAWSCPVEETFDSWPSGYSVLALDRSASSSDFTAPDGLTGQPYVLVNNPGSALAFGGSGSPDGAEGGAVPTSATYGLANSAAPGAASDQASVADAVNPEDGDFSESYADVSIPTYGPALDFVRTYDSELAQAEARTGTPGPLGYGWTENWNSSLSFNEPVPGNIYTADGSRTADIDGGSATSEPLTMPEQEAEDSSGNLYIADTPDNRIQEVAVVSGTQWGISMTAGDVYTIAGSAAGTAGCSTTDGLATDGLLDAPSGIGFDDDGNLYIADTLNNRIEVRHEVARLSGLAERRVD